MNIPSIIQVGPRSAFPEPLREAAALAFPDAVWAEVASYSALTGTGAEAPDHPAAGGGLLLVMEGGLAEVSKAQEALDPEQLPRWAVLRFGESGDSLPAAGGWTAPHLAQLLRSAVREHALQRENARLRGDLLTMARRVSHDLRTPLGGILATVDMLAEITPDGSAAVRPLFSSVDEITKIINRTSFLLKAIARPLPKKMLNMGLVLQEAVMRLERPITQRQATLSRPPEWPQISGVESWLEIIWWNLLHNALHHGGQTPLIELGWERVEQGHRFWIRDNGAGVAPSARENLFRPFHLLHDPNAPRGFGLPIVRGLVGLQGGQCGYDPQPEGGAGFHFTLPDPA